MVEIIREELRQLEKIASLREENELLMYTVVNLLSRMVHFCHQKDIPIENEIAIKTMLSEARKLLQRQDVPTEE
jgi:hypothetical protein